MRTDQASTHYDDLFNSENMSDVVFIVKGRRFYGHKFVLASASEVFHNQFYGASPVLGSEIEIEDCEVPEDFLEFLSLIYRKSATVTWKNARQLSHLRKKYRISVEPKIFCNLLESINKSNALKVLKKCVAVGEEEMIEVCMKVVRGHIEELSNTNDFFDLDQPSLAAIVKQDNLNMREIDLILAVDRWCSRQVELKIVQGKMTTKREVIGEALYHLRFPTLTMANFFKHFAYSTLLTGDEFRALSREIVWRSEYGYSHEEFVTMTNRDGHEFTALFPSSKRGKGFFDVNLLADSNPPYFDEERLHSGYLVFRTNTDVRLKGIKSAIRESNFVTINNIQIEIECYRPGMGNYYILQPRHPFEVKAGKEYKISCKFGYRRDNCKLPWSYTWGDFQCKVLDIEPSDRFANIMGLILLANNYEPVPTDDEPIIMDQEEHGRGWCTIF